MKRFVYLFIICILFLSFLSCGSSEFSTLESSENEAELTTVFVSDTIDYQSIQNQMSNYVNFGRYYIDNGWIYTWDYSKPNNILVKYRLDGSDYTVLSKSGLPSFINVDGEYIYSVISKKIIKCRLGGTDFKQIVKDSVEYLQILDDKLYYAKYDDKTQKTKAYYSSDKDGLNEILILDKEIYSPYIIGEKLYYQDDNDNESIHIYNLETKEDILLANGPAYSFVIDGKYGYFVRTKKTAAESDYSGDLVKINLDTKEETVIYSGVNTGYISLYNNSIYFINTNDESRIYRINKDGSDIKLISQDSYCRELGIFNNSLLYVDLNKDKYLEAMCICDLDGSNKIDLVDYR